MGTESHARDRWFAQANKSKCLSKLPDIKPRHSGLLHARIEVLGQFKCSIPERNFHGYIQRSSGAWKWSVRVQETNHIVGSQYTMRECLDMGDEELERAIDW